MQKRKTSSQTHPYTIGSCRTKRGCALLPNEKLLHAPAKRKGVAHSCQTKRGCTLMPNEKLLHAPAKRNGVAHSCPAVLTRDRKWEPSDRKWTPSDRKCLFLSSSGQRPSPKGRLVGKQRTLPVFCFHLTRTRWTVRRVLSAHGYADGQSVRNPGPFEHFIKDRPSRTLW